MSEREQFAHLCERRMWQAEDDKTGTMHAWAVATAMLAEEVALLRARLLEEAAE